MFGVLTGSRTGCQPRTERGWKEACQVGARPRPPLPRSSASFCVFFKISRVHSVTFESLVLTLGTSGGRPRGTGLWLVSWHRRSPEEALAWQRAGGRGARAGDLEAVRQGWRGPAPSPCRVWGPGRGSF